MYNTHSNTLFPGLNCSRVAWMTLQTPAVLDPRLLYKCWVNSYQKEEYTSRKSSCPIVEWHFGVCFAPYRDTFHRSDIFIKSWPRYWIQPSRTKFKSVIEHLSRIEYTDRERFSYVPFGTSIVCSIYCTTLSHASYTFVLNILCLDRNPIKGIKIQLAKLLTQHLANSVIYFFHYWSTTLPQYSVVHLNVKIEIWAN